MGASFQIAGSDDGDIMLVNGSGVETGVLATPLRIDPTGTTTQPISATSLPLPAGASTSALQTTGNSSLSSIDTKTPALGQTTMSASQPVVIASNQTAIPTSYSDTAPATQNITAFDTVTTTFVGANSQNFYAGTPTVNSAASFALSAIGTVMIEATLIGAGGTMVVEVSMDGGTFWLRPNVFQVSTQSYTNSFTSPFIAVVNTAGMTNIRVRGTVSWTGTATILVKETINQHMVTIGDALPTGANTVGSIANISGTVSLPTGAATSALQTSGNSSLSSIDSKTPALGQALAAASTPVVLTAAQISTLTPLTSVTVTQATGTNLHAVVDSGSIAVTSSALPTGAATEVTLIKIPLAQGSTTSGQSGVLEQGAVTTAAPSYTTGQTSPLSLNTAGGLRVDGSGVTQPISAASLPLPSGAATSANQSTANASLASIDAGIPAALGQTTSANSMSVVIASDQSTLTVSSVNVGGTRATYSAVISDLLVGALATDFFTLTGSATKTIRVTKIGFSGFATAAAQPDVILLKRSTANSAGTSSTRTAIPHDSTSAAATAVVRAYTANPTTGTLVGQMRVIQSFMTGTTTQPTVEYVWEFGEGPSQGIILRGTSEVLALNLDGVTVLGLSVDIYIEFTEE